MYSCKSYRDQAIGTLSCNKDMLLSGSDNYYYEVKISKHSHTRNPLGGCRPFHFDLTQRLPYYMILASIGTSFCSMHVTMVLLKSQSGYNINCRPALPLGCQRHECPDYEIPPVGNANSGLIQILSAIIVCTLLNGAVYRNMAPGKYPD